MVSTVTVMTEADMINLAGMDVAFDSERSVLPESVLCVHSDNSQSEGASIE